MKRISFKIKLWPLAGVLVAGVCGAVVFYHQEYSYHETVKILAQQHQASLASNQANAIAIFNEYESELERNPGVNIGAPIDYELVKTHLEKAKIFSLRNKERDVKRELNAAHQILENNPKIAALYAGMPPEVLLKKMLSNERKIPAASSGSPVK